MLTVTVYIYCSIPFSIPLFHIPVQTPGWSSRSDRSREPAEFSWFNKPLPMCGFIWQFGRKNRLLKLYQWVCSRHFKNSNGCILRCNGCPTATAGYTWTQHFSTGLLDHETTAASLWSTALDPGTILIFIIALGKKPGTLQTAILSLSKYPTGDSLISACPLTIYRITEICFWA